MKDFYEILGISKNASQDEIKKAFRHLAHQYHPDKGGGDEKKFKEINAAYQVLSDPERRTKYDEMGHTAFEQAAAGATGASWEDFVRQGGFGGMQFDFGDLGDVFGDLFGFGRQSRTAQRSGRDIAVDVTLEFSEAVFGIKKDVRLYRTVTCSRCSGNGAEPGTKISQCQTCKGRGQVIGVQRTFLGNIQTAHTCSACHGTGSHIERPCSTCRGNGVEKKEETLRVTIPAGIDNGESLRLSGQGEAGGRGARAGDLYLTARVKKDKRFMREGADLTTHIPITVSQATLGAKVDVGTLDGTVCISIPSGTKHGTTLTLKNLGVPHLQKQGRGSLLVVVDVQIPTHLSKKSRDLFEQLQKEGL